MTNQEMVEELVERRALRSEIVKQAFLKIDRVNFVLEEEKVLAYGDFPLPISKDATISQPYTVALMLEWLEAQPGEKVLEVGCGSGRVVGLLGEIVGPRGKVYGTELDPGLVKFGQKNIKKSDLKNIIIIKAEDVLGYTKEAPFDKILVSAAAKRIPETLMQQLKVGGTMVIPVEHSIYRIKKRSETKFSHVKFDGFSFVPLIE